jgi:hypothetical protein
MTANEAAFNMLLQKQAKREEIAKIVANHCQDTDLIEKSLQPLYLI